MVREEVELVPQRVVLGQNYPNPFNSKTVIPYVLASAGMVELVVYNLLGQQVAVLVNQRQEAEVHQIHWDGYSTAQQRLASGVYFYRLKSAEGNKVAKLVLLE